MKSRYRLLSYPVHPDIPVYGDTPKPAFQTALSIGAGDACNTAAFVMSNHSGTHVDAPRHFIADGRPISDYTADELMFERPVLVEAPAGPGELIGPEPFEALGGLLEEADFLLVRTGFWKRRGSDPLYHEANPGLSEAAARVLREKGARLRGVGLDSISVGSFQHRETGRAAHRILLGEGQGRSAPLLLVEDMDLSGDLSGLKRLWVAPLMLEGLDGAPCTVMAEFDAG